MFRRGAHSLCAGQDVTHAQSTVQHLPCRLVDEKLVGEAKYF
jgi:hypothetical protein